MKPKYWLLPLACAVLAIVGVAILAARGHRYAGNEPEDVLRRASIIKTLPPGSSDFCIFAHPRLEVITFRTEEEAFADWAEQEGYSLSQIQFQQPKTFRHACDLQQFETVFGGLFGQREGVVVIFDRSRQGASVYRE